MCAGEKERERERQRKKENEKKLFAFCTEQKLRHFVFISGDDI